MKKFTKRYTKKPYRVFNANLEFVGIRWIDLDAIHPLFEEDLFEGQIESITRGRYTDANNLAHLYSGEASPRYEAEPTREFRPARQFGNFTRVEGKT